MRITPLWLHEPGLAPLWRYGLMAWLLASLPSLLIHQALYFVARVSDLDLGERGSTAFDPDSLRAFIGIVVFAPLAETALLGIGLSLLLKVVRSETISAYTAALGWGLLHFTDPIRPLGTAWAFLVFSYAFIAWRKRSAAEGYVAACIPHLLGNLSVFLLVVYWPDA